MVAEILDYGSILFEWRVKSFAFLIYVLYVLYKLFIDILISELLRKCKPTAVENTPKQPLFVSGNKVHLYYGT